MDQDEDQTSTGEARRDLGRTLSGMFAAYKSARRGVEVQWLKNLRQFLGKYDPETEQKMDANTSRAYPKLTRVKCVSMRARLMALLFPAGEKNWGIQASPVPNLPPEVLLEALNQYITANPDVQLTQELLDQLVKQTADAIAERLETTIDDQLKDIGAYGAVDYQTLVGRVVASAILYGPGVMKGPMTIADTVTGYRLGGAGVPQVESIASYRPYFEFVSVWDYYPDMTAADFSQLDGEFQRHVMSKQQFLRLADREDFDGDLIREFVRMHPDGNYQKSTNENELDAISGAKNDSQAPRKYEAVEYWGSTKLKTLRAAGAGGAAELEGKDDDVVRYCAWLVDHEVIKLNVNPFADGVNVYHKFIFEEDEVNLLGSGLPPIMRDSQLSVSSSARMLIDNASVVCGPNVEVDVELLSQSQTDYAIRPRKVWLKEGGNGTQRAVQSLSFDSHIPELSTMVRMFKDFADEETFINPLTGGDIEGVPGEALRTTGGASMVYGNAALPFRDIVRNFDQFTVSGINSLADWNRLFNPNSDKLIGDSRPVPRGATSLMAKEIRAFALDQLATTLTEEDRLYLNTEELLRQRLAVRDLPLDQLMAPKPIVEQRMQERAQQSQAQLAQAQAMFAAQLKNLDSDTIKALSQAQKNLDNADVAVFKALLEAANDGASAEELAGIARRITEGRDRTGTGPVPPEAQGVA